MTLGIYRVGVLRDGYLPVEGRIHGRYDTSVVAQAIVDHARLAGGRFEVHLPVGEPLHNPSIPKLHEHIDTIIEG